MKHIGKIVFPAAVAAGLLLAACGQPAPASSAPVQQTAQPAAAVTAAPTAVPTAQSTAAPEPGLAYDEMRLVPRLDSVPSTMAEGVFTVCKDGLWGLIRADGTELLPCLAQKPVADCGNGHWVWQVDGMDWEQQDAYTVALQASGDGAVCPGHGLSTVQFFYDLDYPGRDPTALDARALRAYRTADGPGTAGDITQEDWQHFGDLLPVYSAHRETDADGNTWPGEPVGYWYISREGWGVSPPDITKAGWFCGEALAPVQVAGGGWAYLGSDPAEFITEAVYEPVCYDAEGYFSDEPAVPTMAAQLQNGYAAVCRDGRWGLLDAGGREVIPCGEDGVAWEGTQLWRKDAAGWHSTALPA